MLRERGFLEKLIVTLLVNKFPPFMGTEGSSPSSKDFIVDPLLSEINPVYTSCSILLGYLWFACRNFVHIPVYLSCMLHTQPISSYLYWSLTIFGEEYKL
jgi:hypothetical protein